MSWRFAHHRGARYGVSDEPLEPSRVTYIDFDTWKALYNGDPENWVVCKNSNYTSGTSQYRLPAYRKNLYNSDKYHKFDYIYIKFLTARDYRRYNAFIDEMFAKGEDAENLKELAELTSHIQKIANKRLEQAQAEMQKAIDDTQRLIEATKTESIREIRLDEKGRLMWR